MGAPEEINSFPPGATYVMSQPTSKPPEYCKDKSKAVFGFSVYPLRNYSPHPPTVFIDDSSTRTIKVMVILYCTVLYLTSSSRKKAKQKTPMIKLSKESK